MGDIHLGALGLSGGLLVGLGDKAEATEGMTEVLDRIGARPAGDDAVGSHDRAITDLVDSRQETREARFTELYHEFADLLEFAERFETCRLCFNCRKACPICYCRECLFEGPTFEPEGAKFIRWADKKGLLPLPADVVLFHLTRMNHMVLSCVGCGQCTSACPNDLPVAELFSAFGERARALFDYQPGTSYDVAPPLTVFREQELAHVTEPMGKVMSE